ncbi:MAG TPA: zinc ribbon domain-containing protein [Phycisphaerae bacterium]|nr:zinc ribbon domain-containing protein [Phycisphaerae bacterium]
MSNLLPLLLLDAHGRIVCVIVVIAVFVLLSVLRKPRLQCPRCQTINRPGARYCAQCGARLNTP